MSYDLVARHAKGLKVYIFYINDAPWLILTYYTARANMAAYKFDWRNCYKVI